MKKPTNRHYNNFLSNSRINVTLFNHSGIITNNQNYLQGLENNSWEPPPDWLELPRLQEGDQRFVGLLAIIQGASGATASNADSNFIALLCQGNYIVDWGNGVTSAHTSNTQAQYQYNFADIPNSTLTTQGYKQVIVQAYPQAGATLTTVALNRRYTATGITLSSDYKTGWLDIKFVGRNISTLVVTGLSPPVIQGMLKRFEYIGPSSITNFDYSLFGCRTIEKIMGQRWTENCTSLIRFSSGCYSLSYLDLIHTRNVQSFLFGFTTCYALHTFPPIHTGNATQMADCFSGCVSLKNIPFLDVSKATTASGFFFGCASLKRIPDLNFGSNTTFASMFYGCYSLEECPNINTSNGTDFSLMFMLAPSLRKVGNLDTSKGTNFSQMFNNTNLPSMPNFNFTSGVTFTRMFFGTNILLQKFPASAFPKGRDFTEFFYGTSNLIEVDTMDFSGITVGSTAANAGPFLNLFTTGNAIQSLKIIGCQKSINISNQNLCAANLNYIFENLVDVTGTGATINITNNWGTAQCNRTIATSKGWVVTG
jgi:hypothetical protein